MHLLLNDYNRVLYDDNSSFTEYSSSLKNWTANTMGAVLTKDEDYIYIGCPHTFASRFIYMGSVVNNVSASLTVEYYTGSTNEWCSVKNLMDETSLGGVPLAQSGFLSWDLPDLRSWVKCSVNSIPQLDYGETAADGKGLYWIRISSSETLKEGTVIQFLGVIWTTQAYMQLYWFECNDSRYLPTGKTDWYETIELATRRVGDDLNKANIIDYELQAKDISELGNLTALKALIIILAPMRHSETLQKMLEDFKEWYVDALKVRLKSIDTNKDEKISNSEKKPMTNTRIMRF